jgi:pimeloyl-ACP methyl ester carboxylesterase
LKKNGPAIAPTITVDRMVQDAIELTEYLLKHLGKKKIITVGHSFSTIIELGMVRARPELFYAYVGTGQVADETKNYIVAYDELLKKARAVGNQQAIAELSHAGPPPYESGGGYRVQWKWANAFEGADQFLAGTIGLTLAAPGGSVQVINDKDWPASADEFVKNQASVFHSESKARGLERDHAARTSRRVGMESIFGSHYHSSLDVRSCRKKLARILQLPIAHTAARPFWPGMTFVTSAVLTCRWPLIHFLQLPPAKKNMITT